MPNSVDGDIRLSVNFDDNGIKKGVRTTESAVSGLQSSLGKLGKAAAAAFSVAAIVNFGKQAIDLASDIEEVQNVVDTAFGDMAYKCEEFADTAIEQFGMSKLSAKQTASTYMAMAKSMGLSMESASDMAVEVAKLTGDVASFYNLDQATAATKLKSIFTGETETLKDLGVVMTETNLNEYALSKGIKKKYSAMTQAEKVSLRYAYVTNALSDASGDFVRTQDSWANQTRILSEQWKEFMSIIGSALVQVLTSALQLLNRIVAALTETAKKIQAVFSALNGTNQQDENQTKNIVAAVGAQEDLTSATEETAEAQKKSLAGFDEINKISSDTAETAAGTTDVLDIGNISGDQTTLTAVEGISNATAFAERIKQAFDPLKDIDTSKLEDSLSNIKDSLGGFASETFSGLLWGVENVFTPLAEFTIEDALPGFLNTLSTSIDTAKAAMKGIKKPFKTFYDKLLKPLADYTKPKITEYLDDFNSKLSELNQWIEDTEAFDDLNTIISALCEVLEPVLKYIVDIIEEVGKFVLNNQWTEFEYILENIADFLGLIAAVINGDFSDAYEHAKDLLVDNKIDKGKKKIENLKTAVDDITSSVKTYASTLTEKAEDAFSTWSENVSNWWDNDVTPWFTKEKWSGILQNIGEQTAYAVADMRDRWNNDIKPWWENDVAPWFTKEKWIAVWNDACDSVDNFFNGENGFVQTWKSRISSWWENDVTPWFTKEKWVQFGNDMRDGLVNGFKDVVTGIANIINKIVDGVETLVNGVIWGINQIIEGYNNIAEKVNLPEIGTLNKVDFSKYKIQIPQIASGSVTPTNPAFSTSAPRQTDLSTDKIAQAVLAGLPANAGASASQSAILEIDGEKFGRLVYRLNKREGKRVGVNFSEG